MTPLSKLSYRQLVALHTRLWVYITPEGEAFKVYHRRTAMLEKVSNEIARRIGL